MRQKSQIGLGSLILSCGCGEHVLVGMGVSSAVRQKLDWLVPDEAEGVELSLALVLSKSNGKAQWARFEEVDDPR